MLNKKKPLKVIMVDRNARDQIIAALQAYMEERITAFAFDEALSKVNTDDRTARDICTSLWFHYDDVIDHHIVANREEWDYFNRILLLLQSDGELVGARRKVGWNARQLIALICLLLFAGMIFHLGFGEHLLLYTWPFGIVSFVLAILGRRETERRERTEAAIFPFPSFASLLNIRRQLAGFTRRQYPKALKGRQVRSPLGLFAAMLPWYVAWLLLGPIPLFFQALPECDFETRIALTG